MRIPSMLSIQFEAPVLRHLSWLTVALRYLYQGSTIFLFCLLCTVAKDALQSINEEINTINNYRPQSVITCSRRWKQQFLLTCSYVDELSTAFGLILVVWVVYTFIGITTHTFYFYVGNEDLPQDLKAMLAIFVGRLLFDFFMLCLVAESIPQQVRTNAIRVNFVE